MGLLVRYRRAEDAKGETMAEGQGPRGSEGEVSEAQIAVHWREEEIYPPPPKFVAQANAADPAILDPFTQDKFPRCFTEYAHLPSWDQPWHTVLDTSNPPFWEWFTRGRPHRPHH